MLYTSNIGQPRMGRTTGLPKKPPRAVGREANNAYMREWRSRPGNRERMMASQRRWRSKPEVKERINKYERDKRERGAPTTTKCVICGEDFPRPYQRGRPRIYCNKCVRRFERSDRKCPRCGRIIDRWRRRFTCRNCGALWMRGRVA